MLAIISATFTVQLKMYAHILSLLQQENLSYGMQIPKKLLRTKQGIQCRP